MTKFTILTLICSLCLSCDRGRESANAISSDQFDPVMTNIFSTAVDNLPDWMGSIEGEETIGDNCLQILQLTDKQYVDTLRSYVELLMANGRYSTEAMAKLYLLNRVFFNVPEWEDKEQVKFYGGFIGVPVQDEKINLIWPLIVRNTGEYQVENVSAGYAGDDYLAVEEAVAFSTMYGKRNSVGD